MCAIFWLYDNLVAFLICQPLAFNWDQTIPGGHCGNGVAAYIAAHSINFALDGSLAILPMPVLWGLQMPTRKKIEISIMFSLGTLFVHSLSLPSSVVYMLTSYEDLRYFAPSYRPVAGS